MFRRVLVTEAQLKRAIRAAVSIGLRIKNIVARRDGYVIEIADAGGSDQDKSAPARKRSPLVL